MSVAGKAAAFQSGASSSSEKKPLSSSASGTEKSGAASFTEKLKPEELAYFNEVAAKPFAGQAVAFLNAYWNEVKSDAEFIYSIAWDFMKKTDMHSQGISLLHLYNEGIDLDFDMGLYFYEQLCKFLEDSKNKEWTNYTLSQPVMQTAIVRKKELRDKVDVNFDGRISMLEYLLYQYNAVANPADFCVRSMSYGEEPPEVRAARLALEAVNQAIKEFEAEKARLEEMSLIPGVKGLTAVNLLAQLGASPLAEQLNTALIKAEAALRKAQKKFGSGSSGSGGSGGGGGDGSSGGGGSSDGAMWWMQRDLDEKKKRYAKPDSSAKAKA